MTMQSTIRRNHRAATLFLPAALLVAALAVTGCGRDAATDTDFPELMYAGLLPEVVVRPVPDDALPEVLVTAPRPVPDRADFHLAAGSHPASDLPKGAI
ncbi:MAG: hypothetical protein R6X14_04665 [bacterium]